MCCVTYKRAFVELDQLGEVDLGSMPFYIKHEGIYMFGGVFGDKLGERKMNNKTYFFPIGKGAVHRWKELETTGSPPQARFNHG